MGNQRRVRDHFAALDVASNLKILATDEALSRIATARNDATKTANLGMLISAAIAALYLLKQEGLAGQIKIGDYSLTGLPFGVFVLCGSSLVVSCVSLVRAGDSRSYDRLLRFACEQRFEKDEALAYLLFPDEHSWGVPFTKMVSADGSGKSTRIMRGLSLFFMNLFIFSLLLSPLITGIDFIFSGRVKEDIGFQYLRFGIICFLTLSNFLTCYLLFWIRLVDRD